MDKPQEKITRKVDVGVPPQAVNRGRRELTAYDNNPSLQTAAGSTRTNKRQIVSDDGTKMMIVSESGEIVAPAGFHEVIEVDRSQFVKVYVQGVSALNGLTSAGSKVFDLIYRYVLDNPNNDKIYLYHKDARRMCKATFEKGLTEILNREILYRSTRPHLFFLNICYMFNGNRLALVKEYRMAQEYGKPEDDGQWKEPPLPL